MRHYTDRLPVADRLGEWTLPAVLDAAVALGPERIAMHVEHTGATYTYGELRDTAQRIASGLLGAGETGDRVLLMLPNSDAAIFAWLGSGLAGMVEVPINTAYRGAFLTHQVSTVQPTIAIIDAGFAERFAELPEACASIRQYYVTGDDSAVADAARLLATEGRLVEPFDVLRGSELRQLPKVKPSDLASVFFTSGTTGLSKGVMMPQAHMYFFAAEGAGLTRLGPEDVYMSVGPLFHGNSQFLAAYPSFLRGARFVLCERFSASNWLRQVRETGSTVTNFVGVMMDFVWKQPPTDRDLDHQLRCIFAAPTAGSIVDQFRERFGVAAFVEGFGLTETAMPFLSPYGVPRPAGAAGCVVSDWFDVRLVDENDEEVPVGHPGELIVRPKGPWTSCMGYYEMPDKTIDACRNLWFHTGDGLRCDQDGWFYFVDRIKDAIRRRGENISSYEVEQALLRHPAISQCAVVAVPADVEAGEDEVMAVLVVADGATLDAEAFWGFCDRQLPRFAVPRYVRVRAALPKTPSEKVQKQLLRSEGVTAETFDREGVKRHG